jgi:hypothetical protein
MGDVIPPTGPRSSSSLRPCLSLVTKFADALVYKGAQFEHKFQWPKERKHVAWWIRAFSGSPSFVAVMLSTDLRHRHDGPHFRRLNGSWFR